jgi:phosphate:Na+ symporter
MNMIESLVLGLGLFFVGLQSVGDNLRRVSARSLRAQVARSTRSIWGDCLLGTVFGVLMQSATAVTFILVSMVSSAVIASSSALPVIIWANVGLTALAFVATFNIHPFVAYSVGAAGILVGVVRIPGWRAAAGALFGIALMLYGLETMGQGAAPLKDAAWFHTIITATASAPLLAFLVGIVAAAILQSNTGAALLIITLAGAGAFNMDQAMMLIYGTNLGAIVLRAILSSGLRGTSMRLVRLEDLFCLWSGALMIGLYYLETSTGIPLVKAAVIAFNPDRKLQLAAAFLLSNLLPAITLTLIIHPCWAFLKRFWPDAPEERASRPQYINEQAMAEPLTAMDLLVKEHARLLRHIRDVLAEKGKTASSPNTVHDAFITLAGEVEGFTGRLASRHQLAAASTDCLHRLREELSLIRYLEESVMEFKDAADMLTETEQAKDVVRRLTDAIDQLLALAATAADTLQAKDIETLRIQTRTHGPLIEEVRTFCMTAAGSDQVTSRISLLALVDDFELVAWMTHRLSKLLSDIAPHQVDGAAAATAAPAAQSV